MTMNFKTKEKIHSIQMYMSKHLHNITIMIIFSRLKTKAYLQIDDRLKTYNKLFNVFNNFEV